ncbi:DNA damage-inducible protein 1, partial [Rhizoclosmatium hyalinum]
NCLRINGEEIRFLNEHELPDQARENHASAPEDSAGASSTSAASSSNQSRPAVAPSAASAPKYPESVVKGLMDLGVSRDEAIRALDMAGGNAEMAANYLF